MIFGMFGIIGTHVAAKVIGNLGVLERTDLLFVVFAVEEIGVDPLTAAKEEAPAFGGEIWFVHHASHFFASAKGGQIINATERIRAIEFDVVCIVLDAFHHTVFIGVPAARNPGELNGFLDARPDAGEPFAIARESPIEIGVKDLTHLTVGGGETAAFLTVG